MENTFHQSIILSINGAIVGIHSGLKKGKNNNVKINGLFSAKITFDLLSMIFTHTIKISIFIEL